MRNNVVETLDVTVGSIDITVIMFISEILNQLNTIVIVHTMMVLATEKARRSVRQQLIMQIPVNYTSKVTTSQRKDDLVLQARIGTKRTTSNKQPAIIQLLGFFQDRHQSRLLQLQIIR